MIFIEENQKERHYTDDTEHNGGISKRVEGLRPDIILGIRHKRSIYSGYCSQEKKEGLTSGDHRCPSRN